METDDATLRNKSGGPQQYIHSVTRRHAALRSAVNRLYADEDVRPLIAIDLRLSSWTKR